MILIMDKPACQGFTLSDIYKTFPGCLRLEIDDKYPTHQIIEKLEEVFEYAKKRIMETADA